MKIIEKKIKLIIGLENFKNKFPPNYNCNFTQNTSKLMGIASQLICGIGSLHRFNHLLNKRDFLFGEIIFCI